MKNALYETLKDALQYQFAQPSRPISSLQKKDRTENESGAISSENA
jgi:hypothetical protein